MEESEFMIDVQDPPIAELAPVPVVIHEACDHHSSWRLWFDRREDIKTILAISCPEVSLQTLKKLLFQVEFLQTMDDSTFDLYLLNAVEWAAKWGKDK
jgi:hypothetical protein